MHGRKAALRRPGAALALLALTELALAEGDAAVRAREGSVEHWIEYYRQQRESPSSPQATPAAQAKAQDPKGAVQGGGESGKHTVNRK